MSKKSANNGKATGTQLLDRSVAILMHLSEHGQEGVKSSTLADLLDLNVSTAHRIIAGLERHGLIVKDNTTKLYRLGLTMYTLGAQAADDSGYRRLCRPVLLELAAATGDTVFLMARNGFNAVSIDRQEGSYFIDSLTGHLGGHIPLGVGPASQCILAFMDESEANTIIEINADRYNSYNGLSAKEISNRIPQIREAGYAFDHGRLVEGISAIAVPVKIEGRDAIGAIAINMTSARLREDRLAELVELLNGHVSKIEGYCELKKPNFTDSS